MTDNIKTRLLKLTKKWAVEERDLRDVSGLSSKNKQTALRLADILHRVREDVLDIVTQTEAVQDEDDRNIRAMMAAVELPVECVNCKQWKELCETSALGDCTKHNKRTNFADKCEDFQSKAVLVTVPHTVHLPESVTGDNWENQNHEG